GRAVAKAAWSRLKRPLPPGFRGSSGSLPFLREPSERPRITGSLLRTYCSEQQKISSCAEHTRQSRPGLTLTDRETSWSKALLPHQARRCWRGWPRAQLEVSPELLLGWTREGTRCAGIGLRVSPPARNPRAGRLRHRRVRGAPDHRADHARASLARIGAVLCRRRIGPRFPARRRPRLDLRRQRPAARPDSTHPVPPPPPRFHIPP